MHAKRNRHGSCTGMGSDALLSSSLFQRHVRASATTGPRLRHAGRGSRRRAAATYERTATPGGGTEGTVPRPVSFDKRSRAPVPKQAGHMAGHMHAFLLAVALKGTGACDPSRMNSMLDRIVGVETNQLIKQDEQDACWTGVSACLPGWLDVIIGEPGGMMDHGRDRESASCRRRSSLSQRTTGGLRHT